MSKEITSKTKRLTQILALLEQDSVNVPKLASQLEVSVRTIQRDINLLLQTEIPLISPYQSIYRFAEGFSLKAANLSCEKMALMAISFDIAKQLGGNFDEIKQEISNHFEPPDFENCEFDVSRVAFTSEDTLPLNILDCAQSRVPARIYLKDTKDTPYVYILKLLSIWGKLYIATTSYYGKEIKYYSLNNIRYIAPYTNEIPLKTPFLEWNVWQKAHQWVNNLKQG